MKFKVNKGLLPVKLHFLFFFAALGPLLPQMNVFGKQLGASPAAMGLVTAVLPLLWAAAKPLFGYLVDYFTHQRKLIFMLLILTMSGSYCCLWFLPMPSQHTSIAEYVYKLNDTINLQKYSRDNPINSQLDRYKCHWSCQNDVRFDIWLSNVSSVDTIYAETEKNVSCSLLHMLSVEDSKGRTKCSAMKNCNLMCAEEELLLNANSSDVMFSVNSSDRTRVGTVEEKSVYLTASFWLFVVFMCLGTVAFNVANCIGDAVCFDVLGPEQESRYGWQRAWGTVGYGSTALVGGWLVDLSSGVYKNFTPAFVIALFFTVLDMFSCRALKLPSLSRPDAGALKKVLRMRKVVVFIVFAVVAGTFDSFIIYYMFWFLEELAEQTGDSASIKLIEGVVVAGQSFIGELCFFFLSGKIIERWGYGLTMSCSLFCYAVRMGLVSLITNPWQLVFIESVLQGPTFALCYSCIVGYAAVVAPPGCSATVQGLVAGMDDGLGFALGSLLGGALYNWVGGRASFQAMAALAAAAALAHRLCDRYLLREDGKSQKPVVEEGEKMLTIDQDVGVVYRDTVVSINDKRSSFT